MEVIVPTTWEYCAIVSVTVNSEGFLVVDQKPQQASPTYQPNLQHFLEDATSMKNNKGDNPYALGKEIAELGSMGWELVSVDQGIMYFKRPIY
jgi:hypothetical protein